MPAFRGTRLILILCGLLCAAPYAAHAQQAPTRVVTVTVLTADGQPVTNLTSENIRIRGGDAKAKSFSLDANPRRIVLVLDTSGSMRAGDNGITISSAGGVAHGKSRIAVASALMNLFLDNESPADLLALYQFSDAPREVVPFTHDVGEIRQAMTPVPFQRIKTAGHTDIVDTLDAILTNSQEPLGFGDSIVIFSDGGFDFDEGKGRKLTSYSPQLVQRGIRMFLALAQEKPTVPIETGSTDSEPEQGPPVRPHLYEGDTLGPDPKDFMTPSEVFVAAVGGESFLPADYADKLPMPKVYRSNDFAQRMKALRNAVHDTYRLEVQFAEPLKSKERLRLAVAGKGLHNGVVLSPDFVYPDAGIHP